MSKLLKDKLKNHECSAHDGDCKKVAKEAAHALYTVELNLISALSVLDAKTFKGEKVREAMRCIDVALDVIQGPEYNEGQK